MAGRLITILWGAALALPHPHQARLRPAAAPPVLQAALSGTVVKYGLSGFEPDFDPIDRIVISSTLHDKRPASVALPDSQLVLSAYLENFQPDTTPVLPDLLHPNQTATSLGGFMQGKVALVNAAGHLGYKGSLLAEVFLDNSVHIVIDVQPSGAAASAPTLRLAGLFTLYKVGSAFTVRGALHSARSLTARESASLRVPRGQPVSWQSIVSGLTVHPPHMMGTAGTPHPTMTPVSTQSGAPIQSGSVRMIALAGMVIALAIVILLLWRQRAVPPEHTSRSE